MQEHLLVAKNYFLSQKSKQKSPASKQKSPASNNVKLKLAIILSLDLPFTLCSRIPSGSTDCYRRWGSERLNRPVLLLLPQPCEMRNHSCIPFQDWDDPAAQIPGVHVATVQRWRLRSCVSASACELGPFWGKLRKNKSRWRRRPIVHPEPRILRRPPPKWTGKGITH